MFILKRELRRPAPLISQEVPGMRSYKGSVTSAAKMPGSLARVR